jgi:hypothetical protein
MTEALSMGIGMLVQVVLSIAVIHAAFRGNRVMVRDYLTCTTF